MKTPIALLISCLLFSATAFAQTRIVTATVKGPNVTGLIVTNQIAIGPDESAEVLSAVTEPSSGYDFSVQKDGLEFRLWSLSTYANGPLAQARQVVAGPAIFKLYGSGNSAGYLTLAISPTAFPPDKTVVIPAGTGARISLECSTNLLEWTEVYSTTHTNSPSNKFFRIKAERIP